MYIQYLGHSCFYFNSAKRVKIVIDPYGKNIPYRFPEINADVVVMTHEHYDHNAYHRVGGNPQIVKRTADFSVEHEIHIDDKKELIIFSGIPTYHDSAGGKKKGPNTVFSWFMDGIKFCHLGDLGHLLDDQQTKKISKPDVLFIPVGGNITLDSTEATLVINQLKPSLVFPMHYKTKYIEDKNLADEELDSFLSKMSLVERLDTDGIEIDKIKLPGEAKVIVLRYE